MEVAVYSSILFSLIVSTIFSTYFYKKKASKWLGVLVGFCINTLLLSVAAIAFIKVFNVKEVEGIFASLGVLIFPFFIPIITYINFFVIELTHKKAERNV